MNTDQVKGTAKDIAGKIQEEAGKLVGNETQQIKGVIKQVQGTTQKQVGNVKELIEDAKKI
jgi:uncharacterized protein YjbJ (UPF0337 family)